MAKADPSLNAVDCPSAANRSPLPIMFAPPGTSPNWWVAPTTGDPTGDSGHRRGIDAQSPSAAIHVAGPGQWILDQNNAIHRVLVGRRNTAEGPVRCATGSRRRPLPSMGLRPGVPSAILDTEGAACQAWYLPLRDANGVVLTPVYVSVEEL